MLSLVLLSISVNVGVGMVSFEYPLLQWEWHLHCWEIYYVTMLKVMEMDYDLRNLLQDRFA